MFHKSTSISRMFDLVSVDCLSCPLTADSTRCGKDFDKIENPRTPVLASTVQDHVASFELGGFKHEYRYRYICMTSYCSSRELLRVNRGHGALEGGGERKCATICSDRPFYPLSTCTRSQVRHRRRYVIQVVQRHWLQ
jgi:hypothetical protein